MVLRGRTERRRQPFGRMKLARPKVHAELRLAAEDEDVAAAELTARRPEDARPLPPRLDAAAAARDDNVAVRARLVDPLEIESDLHAARAAREDGARLPRVDEGAATDREPHAHPPAALKQPALQLQRLLALDGEKGAVCQCTLRASDESLSLAEHSAAV